MALSVVFDPTVMVTLKNSIDNCKNESAIYVAYPPRQILLRGLESFMITVYITQEVHETERNPNTGFVETKEKEVIDNILKQRFTIINKREFSSVTFIISNFDNVTHKYFI